MLLAPLLVAKIECGSRAGAEGHRWQYIFQLANIQEVEEPYEIIFSNHDKLLCWFALHLWC